MRFGPKEKCSLNDFFFLKKVIKMIIHFYGLSLGTARGIAADDEKHMKQFNFLENNWN